MLLKVFFLLRCISFFLLRIHVHPKVEMCSGDLVRLIFPFDICFVRSFFLFLVSEAHERVLNLLSFTVMTADSKRQARKDEKHRLDKHHFFMSCYFTVSICSPQPRVMCKTQTNESYTVGIVVARHHHPLTNPCTCGGCADSEVNKI
jgi:hypothetical protein